MSWRRGSGPFGSFDSQSMWALKGLILFHPPRFERQRCVGVRAASRLALLFCQAVSQKHSHTCIYNGPEEGRLAKSIDDLKSDVIPISQRCNPNLPHSKCTNGDAFRPPHRSFECASVPYEAEFNFMSATSESCSNHNQPACTSQHSGRLTPASKIQRMNTNQKSSAILYLSFDPVPSTCLTFPSRFIQAIVL